MSAQGSRGPRGGRPGRGELTAAACVLARILVDLLKLNVAPLAVFQMLKSMCAGQRVASDSQDPTAVPLPAPSVPETRGQSRAGAAGGRRLWSRVARPLLFLPQYSVGTSDGWPLGRQSPAWSLLSTTLEGAHPHGEGAGWEPQSHLDLIRTLQPVSPQLCTQVVFP